MTALRALVADDDPEMLEMVSGIVARELGAEVTRAETGGELLEAIANDEPFDFIVTDISMPWMTGLQVMHSARTAGLPIPVVVMTALRDPSIAEQVEALGDRARLLRKPFGFDDLVAALHEVLHGAQLASVLRSERARSD
jgi:CheY-like chemotaxis protein